MAEQNSVHDVCEALWKRPIRGVSKGRPRMALEMEIFAFHEGSLLPAGLEQGKVTPIEIMSRIAALVPGSKLKVDPVENVATGVELPSGGNFSLEPGGQLEFASRPVFHTDELAADVEEGLNILAKAAAGELVFLGTGTNPLSRPDHPLLLPKERYLVMTRYFNAIPGGRGVHMMRHTGTVQPNLDIPGGDAEWQDAVNLTFVLTPFVRHLFANSAWFQGARSSTFSERQSIWPLVDSSRSLIPAGVPFAPDIPCAYARWAKAASVFYVPGLSRDEQPLPGELSFEAWLEQGYKGTRPTFREWEMHLGTLFPDLRLRGFLEVRSVDAQPFEHMLAPVAFFAGVLQHGRARRRLWEFLLGVGRAYVDCQGFSKAHVSDAPDSWVFGKVLEESPTHPLFSDGRIHRQLLSIAEETLADAHERVGVESLQAYRVFLSERDAYVSAPSARDFVEMHATPEPGQLFVSRLASRGTVGAQSKPSLEK
jgi:glutamate--cysteine ligase